jgi:exodeoxyribonuclease VII small subunit
MMAKNKDKPVEDLNYEEAFQELGDLVTKLDSDELKLEEGLELFERGQLLVEHCSKLLENAELKIKEISTKSSGDFVERNFDLEEE